MIAAIDQGTSSTRCMVFDDRGRVVSLAQAEHEQLYPRPGWVEHDPQEIWAVTQRVVREAVSRSEAKPGGIAAVGITNQRETVVIWDRQTGRPYCNAIVWQDTRTKELCDTLARDGGQDRFRAKTGLPLATYFSGPKIRWALDHVVGLRDAAEQGRAICGTVDSWLIWQLTGGPDGGVHVTDVTNASRAMLMDLRTLDWDDELLAAIGVPRTVLPRIVPSAAPTDQGFGLTRPEGPFGASIPVAAALGDQQAALLGQCCTRPGEAKNTYGTGCFMLLNTGEKPVLSRHGLLTTVGYRLGGAKPAYALEGSIAVTGALVQWLRDNLGLIQRSDDIETLAASVPDSGGVYVVPAFSGLFAPHWRADARGVIVGLTRFVNKGHLARAALEATAYQTREVLDAMRADAGIDLACLKVDGGMTVNDLLMQFQADVLGVPIVRPVIAETTSLGAAYAAGLAAGIYPELDALRAQWRADRTWAPAMGEAERQARCAGWSKAVERSLGWV